MALFSYATASGPNEVLIDSPTNLRVILRGQPIAASGIDVTNGGWHSANGARGGHGGGRGQCDLGYQHTAAGNPLGSGGGGDGGLGQDGGGGGAGSARGGPYWHVFKAGVSNLPALGTNPTDNFVVGSGGPGRMGGQAGSTSGARATHGQKNEPTGAIGT